MNQLQSLAVKIFLGTLVYHFMHILLNHFQLNEFNNGFFTGILFATIIETIDRFKK